MSHLEIIAKAVDADPTAATVLMNEIVYSYLADEAEKVRPELQNLLGAFVAQRTAIAKRAIGRAYVESTVNGEYPSDDIHKSAEWISGIEQYVLANVQKDLTGTSLIEFNRKHPRGQGGRFSRGIPQMDELKSSPFSVKPEKWSPTVANNIQVNSETSKPELLDPADKDKIERNQFQWEAANRNVSEIMSNFSRQENKDIDLLLNIQNPATGDVYQKRVNAGSLDKGRIPQDDRYGWNLNHNLISVEVEGRGAAADQVAAYNTLGAVGGSAFAQLSSVDPNTLNNFTREMYRSSGKDKTKLTRFFDRLGAGGAVLSQIDPLKQYGEYARFVGAVGPEAERVLGPYAQQAAYRYRGTEKEPDLDLVSQFTGPDMRLVEAASEERYKDGDAARAIHAASLNPANKDLVAIQAAEYEINNLSRTRDGVFTPDELLLNVRSDIAARHLLNTLPSDPFVAEVSEKAGQVLPSQGVIIDADGDVVSQSVGFTDDHYLPFDLKNLTSLRGGQYVRTRQQGGLTSEDIYTATRAGARMATVVSSSGVFSVEFDPTFRGARANSDKAKQMYDRYIKILDAVDGAGLYELDIKPAEKAKLRASANRLSPNDKKKAEDIYQTYLEQRRTAGQSIDPGTEDILEQQAREIAMSERINYTADRLERRVSDIFDELVAEEQAKRVSQLRLNAKGYKVALETLQQQFPYFIRNVSYHPLTSKTDGEGFLQNLKQSGAAGARQKLGATDRGYVQPGGLRGKNIESGTYRTAPDTLAPKDKSKLTGPAPEPKAEEKPTAGNTGGTSGTPKVETKTTTASIPKGNLSSIIARNSQGHAAEASNLLKDFRDNVLSGISVDARLENVKVPDSEKFEDQKNDVLAATILLDIDRIKNNELKNAFDKDPDRVVRLLSDGKVVKGAIQNLYNSGLPLGARFDSLEDLEDSIVDSFSEIASSMQTTKPFVAPIEDYAESAFYTGAKPQLFSEVNNLSSLEDLQDYLDSHPKYNNAAFELEGTPPQRAKKVKDTLDILKGIPTAVDALREEAISESDDSLITMAGLADQVGVTVPDLTAALGGTPMGILDGGPNVDSIVNDRALDLQYGWALQAAADVLTNQSEGTADAGGEGGPKVVEASKSLVAPLSRQVRFVSKSAPISKTVTQLRQMGLPYVPIRKTK